MTSDETTGRGRLTYYGHNTKELGHEVPTPNNLTINVKLDVETAAGSSTIKQRMRAQLAWLMTEGMELPVELDGSGLATAVDTERLETELEGGKADIDAARKEQTRILYDAPSREELKDLGRGIGEAAKGIGGLFRRKR